MGELSEIKISDLYRSLKYISEKKGLNLLEKDILNSEINKGSDLALKNLLKFNDLILSLMAGIQRQDEKSIKENLIHISVESINIASIFDNLHADVDEFIKELY